jgi:SAM-dependent methyltransferase
VGEPVAERLPLVCPRCRAALAASSGGARCEACGAAYPQTDGILRLLAGESGAPAYDPHYFRTLPLVEDRHFWFVARRQVILEALREAVPDWRTRPLFDVGCGSGGLLDFLSRSGVPLSGACDAHVEGLRLARRRLTAPLLLVDEGRLPPLGTGHAMIGLFDVLEHLDDDREALSWIGSILEPGGVLVLTVPAHPFLFDEMDELAHHRRRYVRRELRAKLVSAGFEVVLVRHFMATLVPLLLGVRLLGRWALGRRDAAGDRRDAELRVVPGLNRSMLAVLWLERLCTRWWPPPFGSSIVAVARRPGPGGRP